MKRSIKRVISGVALAGLVGCGVVAAAGCSGHAVADHGARAGVEQSADAASNAVAAEEAPAAGQTEEAEAAAQQERPLLGSSDGWGTYGQVESADNPDAAHANEGLTWTGPMDTHVEATWLYANYEEACKANPGLEASKDADKDAPVLVCTVFVENNGAVSKGKTADVFDASFMYFNPERVPVTFFAADKAAKAGDFQFKLPKGDITTIKVGFTAPENWWTDLAYLDEHPYVVFGGEKDEYYEASVAHDEKLLVPDRPFIWLTVYNARFKDLIDFKLGWKDLTRDEKAAILDTDKDLPADFKEAVLEETTSQYPPFGAGQLDDKQAENLRKELADALALFGGRDQKADEK